MSAAWGAEAVSVSFGARRALDRVTVSARPGQVTAVVGGDGAGKTTLLRCVAGALPPGAGTVRRPDAQRIGYLPPGSGVYDDLTVAENLGCRSAVYRTAGTPPDGRLEEYLDRTGLAAATDRLAGGHHGRARTARRPRRAAASLAAGGNLAGLASGWNGQPPSRASRRRVGYPPQSLGLYDDLTIAENLAFSRAVFGGDGPDPGLPRRYSGVAVRDLPLGVARRAGFAQVLAHRPDLLLLDEPTSGVDPLARARLWEMISQTAADGAGVIVTTHDMEDAEECTRLVVMTAGRVVAATLEERFFGLVTDGQRLSDGG